MRVNSYILFIISSSTFSFLNVSSFVALPRNHCNQAFISAEERNYVDRLLVTSSSETDDAIQINPLVANVKISKTIEVFSLLKEMETAGDKVYIGRREKLC